MRDVDSRPPTPDSRLPVTDLTPGYDKATARQVIDAALRFGGVTQRELAGELLLSPGRLSQKLGVRYPYDRLTPDEIDRAVRFLDLSADQQQTLLRCFGHLAGPADHRVRESAPAPPPEAAAPSPRPSGYLPLPLTSFVGRERERVALADLLAETRLLTLSGAGGAGKTRLALELARELAERYPDGVWWVGLAALTEPDFVARAIATSLGVPDAPGRPAVAALVDQLAGQRLLLVLDNCEHLVAACARVVDWLLRECPGLTVLATSRERLAVAGETVWRVPSLSLPAVEDRGSGDRTPTPDPRTPTADPPDSVRLFVERARAARNDFALSAANSGAVARICRRLDGIPLALELAAAWVSALPAEQIATRLDRSLLHLGGGSRTALPRQQTLRAAISWSHDLLTPAEQALLRRLAVFAGGFTLEAAEAVCGDDAFSDLMALVQKSLVLLEAEGDDVRYALLKTVREYGEERLEAAGETAAFRGRQRDWCWSLVQQAEPQLAGSDQQRWLDRLETEHDNIRAALDWSTSDPDGAEAGLRLAGALWRFWEIRGHLSEGREWFRRMLARGGGTPAARATALGGAGALARDQRDLAEAEALHEASLALWRALGNQRGVAVALNNLGAVASDQAAYARAIVRYEESLSIWRELRDSGGTALLLTNLGQSLARQGDLARAAELLEEGLPLVRQLGDRRGEARALAVLGTLALNAGDYARSAALSIESLAHRRQIGDKEGIALCLERLADVALAQAEPARAVRLQAAAGALRQAAGVPVAPADLAGHEQLRVAAGAALGDAAFAAAWAEGAALPLDAAVALALAGS